MSTANRIKIIHAEDFKLFRYGLKMGLSSYPGIEHLGEAENGKELLDMLENMKPDVIILNLQMPVMDGFATLPVLKQRYPWIKVIILSMHDDANTVRKMIELGANAYLTKDAEAKEIANAVYACKDNWFYVNKIVVNAFKSFTE